LALSVFTFLPRLRAKKITIGFNSRINNPNCQFIHNRIIAVPKIVKAETLEAIQQIRVSNRETHYYQKLIDSAVQVKEHSIAFAWKSDAATRFSFLIFLFGFDIFRAAAMLMVLYSDLSIGQMLAVFGYLWFMMAPVQEVLGIQYSFYGAKAALERINRMQTLQQEPIYPALINPFLNLGQG
jgi:ATP-binding cassette subfamily C protein